MRKLADNLFFSIYPGLPVQYFIEECVKISKLLNGRQPSPRFLYFYTYVVILQFFKCPKVIDSIRRWINVKRWKFSIKIGIDSFVVPFQYKQYFDSSIRQWSGRPGFNPRSHHTKDFKNGINTSLLNTQQYKVHIKGKVEQSWERSSALPYTSV